MGKPNESELKIRLVNNAEFAIKGSDNPDNLRGAYLTCALLDEFAFHKSGVWQNIIRPMLADIGGDAVFASTPDGYNEFYTLYSHGLNGLSDWKSWQYPSFAGGFITETEMESAKADMTSYIWEQEFLAKFVAQAGRIYYNFDREKHLKKCNFVPGLDIHWFWDFNVNPCVHPGLAHIHKGVVYVFDEICIGETPDTVSEFMARYPVGKLYNSKSAMQSSIKIYGDFTGSFSTTGTTDYQIMDQLLQRNHFPKPEIKVYGGNPIERDRTNAVNTKLLNAADKVGVYIHPDRCPKLIKDMEQVKRSEKSGKIDKTSNPQLTHISDGFGYMVYVEFPPKWAPRPKVAQEVHEEINEFGYWVA